MSVKIYFSQQKMTFFIYRQTEKQLIFNVPKCKENIANNLKAKLKRTNKTIIVQLVKSTWIIRKFIMRSLKNISSLNISTDFNQPLSRTDETTIQLKHLQYKPYNVF